MASFRFKQKSIQTGATNINKYFIQTKFITKNKNQSLNTISSNSSNQSNTKLKSKSKTLTSNKQSMDSLADKFDQNKLDYSITTIQNDPQLDSNTMSSLTPNNNVSTSPSNIDYNFSNNNPNP